VSIQAQLSPQVSTMLAKEHSVVTGDVAAGSQAQGAIGYFADGTSLTTYTEPVGSEHLLVTYVQQNKAGKVLRSVVHLWETNEKAQTGRVIRSGSSVSSLSPVPEAVVASTAGCPIGTTPCRNCYGWDSGIVDCCGPCAFAFIGGLVPGIACVVIWCQFCLAEHCNNWRTECCGGSTN